MRRSTLSRALVLIVALTTINPTVSPRASATEAPSATSEPVQIHAPATKRNVVDAVIRRPAAPIQTATSESGAVPAGGVASRSNGAALVPPDRAIELPGRRSANGRVVANPDGTFTSETGPERLNYRDPIGGWQPIDTRLVADTTAGFTHRTRANDRTVRVSTASAATTGIEIAADDHRVRLRAPGYGSGQVAPTGSRVTYAGQDDRGDLAVLPTPDGLEFTIVLSGPDDDNEYGIVVDAGDLAMTLARDGSIALREDDGTVSGTISAPIVFDARGIRAPRSAVVTTLTTPTDATSQASSVEIHYVIDRIWLAAPSRAYPVTLDPTVCINGQGVTDCVTPPPPPTVDGGCGITDSFDRSLPLDSDGPGWGLSTSGIQWTGSSEYGEEYFDGHTVADGAGISDSATTGRGQMLTLDPAPSMDVSFTLENDEDGEGNSYFYLNLDSDRRSWVAFDERYPDYDHTIEAYRYGDAEVRRSAEDAFASGKNWVRIHIDQDVLQVKIWPFESSEPGSWLVESTVDTPDSSTVYPRAGKTRTFDLDLYSSSDTTRIGSLDIVGVNACSQNRFDTFVDRTLIGDLGDATAGLTWDYRDSTGTYRVNPTEHLTVDAASAIDYAVSGSVTAPSAALSMAAPAWASSTEYGNPWGATDDIVAYVTSDGYGVWVAEKYEGYRTGTSEPDWAQGLLDGYVYDNDYTWYPAVSGWDTVVTAFEGAIGEGQVVRPPTPNGHLYAWYPGYSDETGEYLSEFEWPTDGYYAGTPEGYWWDLGPEVGPDLPPMAWLAQMDMVASFRRSGGSADTDPFLAFYVNDDDYLEIDGDSAELWTDARRPLVALWKGEMTCSRSRCGTTMCMSSDLPHVRRNSRPESSLSRSSGGIRRRAPVVSFSTQPSGRVVCHLATRDTGSSFTLASTTNTMTSRPSWPISPRNQYGTASQSIRDRH